MRKYLPLVVTGFLRLASPAMVQNACAKRGALNPMFGDSSLLLSGAPQIGGLYE